MAKSSQHFYPGERASPWLAVAWAKAARAGDRFLAITNFNVLFDSANLSLRLARPCTTSQNTAEIE